MKFTVTHYEKYVEGSTTTTYNSFEELESRYSMIRDMYEGDSAEELVDGESAEYVYDMYIDLVVEAHDS